MADRQFATFEEFWPHYVAAHQDKTTRLLHFAGTTAAMGCVAGALVFRKKWLLLVAPIVGYGSAWVGHFVFEGNKPATFGHPVWSLRADLLMWWKTLRGEMQAEVDRVVTAEAAGHETAGAQATEPSSATRSEAVN